MEAEKTNGYIKHGCSNDTNHHEVARIRAVAKAASRELADSVANTKGREDPTNLSFGELEFVEHARHREREVLADQIEGGIADK